jgi:hypothetical protein
MSSLEQIAQIDQKVKERDELLKLGCFRRAFRTTLY